jgi:hypothetical protein
MGAVFASLKTMRQQYNASVLGLPVTRNASLVQLPLDSEVWMARPDVFRRNAKLLSGFSAVVRCEVLCDFKRMNAAYALLCRPSADARWMVHW